MDFTLGEAARQTISKAIKTGKLSATHRFRSDTVETDQPETEVETRAATDALVAELRAVIADLRQDRDHWREQAQRLVLTTAKPVEKPMTWWRWLRTTG